MAKHTYSVNHKEKIVSQIILTLPALFIFPFFDIVYRTLEVVLQETDDSH